MELCESPQFSFNWPQDLPWSISEEFSFLNTISPVPQRGDPSYYGAHGLAAALENDSKNRYLDVLPVHDTLVRLGNPERYINASYIRPPSGSPAPLFICAQAPLPGTFYDFFWMIWEQRCPVICALNREYERGEIRGDAYWPRKGMPLTINPSSSSSSSSSAPSSVYSFNSSPSSSPSSLLPTLVVSLDAQEEDEASEVTVRRFMIRRTDTGESRPLIQIHFQGWPDRGVPSSTSSLRILIKLHKDLRCSLAQILPGPSVIHCSAGIGRSGTFVAASFLLQQPSFISFLQNQQTLKEFLENFEEGQRLRTQHVQIPGYYVPPPTPRSGWEERLRPLGVAEIVHFLRRQRNPRMVQTEDQYRFLYEVLRDEIVDSVSSSSPPPPLEESSMDIESGMELEEEPHLQSAGGQAEFLSAATPSSSSSSSSSPSFSSYSSSYRSSPGRGKKRPMVEWEAQNYFGGGGDDGRREEEERPGGGEELGGGGGGGGRADNDAIDRLRPEGSPSSDVRISPHGSIPRTSSSSSSPRLTTLHFFSPQPMRHSSHSPPSSLPATVPTGRRMTPSSSPSVGHRSSHFFTHSPHHSSSSTSSTSSSSPHTSISCLVSADGEEAHFIVPPSPQPRKQRRSNLGMMTRTPSLSAEEDD